MTKQEFHDLAAKETKTEDEQKAIDAHAQEFKEKYFALAEEYGLDFNAKTNLEIVLKK